MARSYAMETSSPIVLVGATGDLGRRIAQASGRRGANLVVLARPGAGVSDLAKTGAEVRILDLTDSAALRDAFSGTACIVSALNGLEDTIVGLQGRVLDAAVATDVPRFIPSDFSLDFTRTAPDRNRNLDLRRRFMQQVDAAPVRATSILNGAFADLLTGQAPIILRGSRTILYWGDPDQPLDFTTRDDVADYTAAAALDPTTPRILRIAGDVVTPRDLAEIMGSITGRRFRLIRPGGSAVLDAMIRLARLVAPQPRAVFPAWQGMQYLRDMMDGRGKLAPLDNGRYPEIQWTRVRQILETAVLPEPGRP